MTGTGKKYAASEAITLELCCRQCGERFLVRHPPSDFDAGQSWTPPEFCSQCHKNRQMLREAAKEQQEAAKWQEAAAKEKSEFHNRLKDWKTVETSGIRLADDNALCILGNGFDLMHNVRSSYYAFRDSIGKNSELRTALELYLTPEDIWVDFENSLAQLRVEAMAGNWLVAEWLDLFGAFDEDASAASFHMAAEQASDPMRTIGEELPRRFRQWVDSLTIGTADRPLNALFQNSKVLCFNYTEFVEMMYGVPEENVCYIHGSRKRRKGRPLEKLILGHLPGASEDAYAFDDDCRRGPKDPFKRRMVELAQENAIRIISEWDEALTKDSRKIISEHQDFFDGLGSITTVATIGHSFAPVDQDYFAAVAAALPDPGAVRWCFGCHGLHDLERLEQMLVKIGLDRSNVYVCPTDSIRTDPLPAASAKPAAKVPEEKVRCVSEDGRWQMITCGTWLSIRDTKQKKDAYRILCSVPASKGFFAQNAGLLFVTIFGAEPGVLLFRRTDERWQFVNELYPHGHMYLLNRRLNHVYLTGSQIAFVYNNRVCTFSLDDGNPVSSRAVRNARFAHYEGLEVGQYFKR